MKINNNNRNSFGNNSNNISNENINIKFIKWTDELTVKFLKQ